MEKLQSLNGHYIRESADAVLLADVERRLAATLLDWPPRTKGDGALSALLPEAKARAKTLVELADNLAFLFLRSGQSEMDAQGGDRLLNGLRPARRKERTSGALTYML